MSEDQLNEFHHTVMYCEEESEYAALQHIADGTDRSLAWLGRKAICDFIKHCEHTEASVLAGCVIDERTRQSTQ